VERRAIDPWGWQDKLGIVPAWEVSGSGRTLVCSGFTSSDDDANPRFDGDIAAQITAALDRIETVLKAAGMDWPDVVRLNVYTTDIDAVFAHYEALMGRLRAGGARVAGCLLGVARLGHPASLVEIEATAMQ
jgi:enamine deaminase RidA (YjgF/YER057c/UK114 family)